jgi:hypothetical protein
MAPLAKILEPLPGLIHLGQDSLGMPEELLASLSQDYGSAHPV